MACKIYLRLARLLIVTFAITGNNFSSFSNTHTFRVYGGLTTDRRETSGRPYVAVQIPGDVILGGLFPVHAKGVEGRCGTLNEQVGIHRLEAMLYAIDVINRDSTLLPNISLGANIRDDCETVNTGLEQCLNFLQGPLRSRDNICSGRDQSVDEGPTLAGVVGPSYSSLAIQVASLLRLFQVPQVSYAATSSALSAKNRFDYFVRTVPPDSFQARAIVDIIRGMNWSAVFAINSRGSYGEGGMRSFEGFAGQLNVCIAESVHLEPMMSPTDYDNVIRRFLKEPGVRVVVMFCVTDDISSVLLAVKRLKLTNHFLWLASDFWGSKYKQLDGLEDVASGAVTIELLTLQTHLTQLYNNFFVGLTPANNSRNPWFGEYWENHFKCKLGNTSTTNFTRRCHGNESLQSNLKVDAKVSFVVDAVLAFAHALNNLHQDACGGKPGMCYDMKRATRERLISYLYNVTFNGTTGKVQFDSNGDVAGRYDLLQYRNTGKSGGYTRVGNWIEGVLNLDVKSIVKGHNKTNTQLNSQCGLPCRPGYKRRIREWQCCWSCVPCDAGSYLSDDFTCVHCARGKRPDSSYRACKQLPVRYIETAWKVVISSVAGLGILTTLFMVVIFIKFGNTPLIMAAGRELSCLLFLGIILCYILALVMVIEPDPQLCGVRRFSIGISFCLCYSSLLVRTNRIARIFSGTKSPSFISPKSQLLITGLLITPEVAIASFELYVSPPDTEFSYENTEFVTITCKIRTLAVVLQLCYNVILILLCTYYAFRTRKTPFNFNEAKYIGFCMYTTCVIWIAFLPMYYGTGAGYDALAVCFSSVLSATTILVFIFMPKVYIVILKPEKNLKSNSRLRSRTKSVEIGSTENNSETDKVSSRGLPHSPSITTSTFKLSPSDSSSVILSLQVPKV